MPSSTSGSPQRLAVRCFGVWAFGMAPTTLLVLAFLVPESDYTNLGEAMPSFQMFLQFSKAELPPALIRSPVLPGCPHTRPRPLTGPRTPTLGPQPLSPRGLEATTSSPSTKIRKSTQRRLLGGSSVPIATPRRTRVALPAGWLGRSRDVTAPLSGG